MAFESVHVNLEMIFQFAHGSLHCRLWVKIYFGPSPLSLLTTSTTPSALLANPTRFKAAAAAAAVDVDDEDDPLADSSRTCHTEIRYREIVQLAESLHLPP